MFKHIVIYGILFLILLLAACQSPRVHYPVAAPSTSIINKKAPSIKLKPCPHPDTPSSLKHPLPLDNPQLLIDKLTNKLEEWVSYGNKAEKAFDKCGTK